MVELINKNNDEDELGSKWSLDRWENAVIMKPIKWNICLLLKGKTALPKSKNKGFRVFSTYT